MADEKVLTNAIEVDATAFARIVQERAVLAQKVDDLQERGTTFMKERQEVRRLLTTIVEGEYEDLDSIKGRARNFLKAWPT